VWQKSHDFQEREREREREREKIMPFKNTLPVTHLLQGYYLLIAHPAKNSLMD
jgi:hypothetical protein